MKPKAKIIPFPTTPAFYLAADAINNLVQTLPCGTAYFIGICLVVMMTGHLSSAKGSLARAVFPFVCHLRWGWHRAERALERGKLELDSFFEIAFEWTLRELKAEVVKLGSSDREVQAIDSSTIARFRALKRLEPEGKAYWGRAGKAVRANIVAALTSVVIIEGIRLGIVRRTRFGSSCEVAVENLFNELPDCSGNRLLVVDAGIATKEQFAAATEKDALMGRLRINVKLRGKAGARKGERGRFPIHGEVLHPGHAIPEWEADESFWLEDGEVAIRLRRWREVHFQEEAKTLLDVVRIDDPRYEKPLLIGTTARELRTEEFFFGYKMRSSIETNFYVGQSSCAMEEPRAFTQKAVTRRISLSLLCGSLLKAIAAKSEAIAIGPWDRKAERTGGRLCHYLGQYAFIFAKVALAKVYPRKYERNENAEISKDLSFEISA